MHKHITTPPSLRGVIPKIKWNKLQEEELQKLATITNMQGEWSQLDTSHTWPFGYFKCKADHQTFFVKLVSKEKGKSILKGDRIASHLSASLKVNCVISELSQQEVIVEEHEVSLLVYPYMDARVSNFSNKDIKSIAIALATCHNALLTAPNKELIEKDSNHKIDLLHNTWQAIKEKVTSNAKLPKQAEVILLNEDISLLALLKRHAQVNHGDLNIGNILFNDGQAIFIDFENSLHSFMSPFFDLSYIIQRYIIIQNKEDVVDRTRRFIQTYIEHYHLGEALNKLISTEPSIIGRYLHVTAIFGLLILSNQLINNEMSVANSEWEKFIYLYESAAKLEITHL